MLDDVLLGPCSLRWKANRLDISPGERVTLREPAVRPSELVAFANETRKRKLWYRNNALQDARPLAFCDAEKGWNTIIAPADLQGMIELSQAWEMVLRKEIQRGTHMLDDR